MPGLLQAATVAAVSSYFIFFSRYTHEWRSWTGMDRFYVSTDVSLGAAVIYSVIISILFLMLNAVRKARGPSRNIIINKHEDQIGYLIPPGRSKRETINLLHQVKRAGEIPPIYPNGWYEVMRSEDLPVGGVKAVSLIEKHLVVFRSEKGRVSIMDAYCPHLGANLGVGGIVKGECIKCPFHGWEYDGETGQCVNIPYADKVPAFAKTNVWLSIEQNGLICVWFDAEGREPPYLPQEIPQISAGKWSYIGCCVHYVNAHVQDLVENAADVAHFKTIHGPAIGGGSSINFQDSNSNWFNRCFAVHLKINWEVLPPPNDHIGRATIDSYYTVLNKWKLPFKIHAELHQVGPGFLLTTVQLPFAEGIFIQTFVPEGPMLIRMTSHLYFDWWVPDFIANNVLQELATQVDRDVLIWNNKTHHAKPLLLKEEEGILRLRRWFSQFYSENSPRLNIKKNLDSLVW